MNCFICQTCNADDGLYQQVSIESPCTHLKSNDIVNVHIIYDVSDQNQYLTGIGFKIHFDPEIFEYIESQFFDYEASTPIPAEITQCYYNDETDIIDSCIAMGWLSTGSYWPSPYYNLPLELMLIKFKVKENLKYLITELKIEKTANTTGYDFKPINKKFTIEKPIPADVNNDGLVDLTDIINLIQHCSQQ